MVVGIEKLAEVFPAGMVIVPGTDALVWSLMSDIESPEGGAGELITTDPAAVLPPTIEEGLTLTETRLGAVTVRFPEAEPPPQDAVRVAVTVVPTEIVFTEKVTLRPFAGTTTVAGGIAADWLLLNFTVIPPVGAGPLRVTLPVEATPPTTDDGVIVKVIG